MARKYDLISELYNRTCKTVVSNPQNWQAFLASACRNYKLRYDEQLLVYAQRPDATAVLEIEQWNKIFGRWVNRGARGIAVFADENRSRQRLTHYFDISDTHESRYSRTVPIWDMRQEYEADVIETLESTFGEIENKSSLAELYFDTVQRNYVVKLKGETSRDVPLGDDSHGNIVRIDNGIERFEEALADTKNSLENTEKQFETAKQEIEKPFAKEEELRAKTARLDELNILLNMDKKENEIVGGEPDEGEAVGGRKEKSYER